jgi:hypothetical protein
VIWREGVFSFRRRSNNKPGELLNFPVAIYCPPIMAVPLVQSTPHRAVICHHVNPEIALVLPLTLVQEISILLLQNTQGEGQFKKNWVDESWLEPKN